MSLERGRQHDVDLCDREMTNDNFKNYIPAGSSTDMRNDNIEMKKEYITIKSKSNAI